MGLFSSDGNTPLTNVSFTAALTKQRSSAETPERALPDLEIIELDLLRQLHPLTPLLGPQEPTASASTGQTPALSSTAPV